MAQQDTPHRLFFLMEDGEVARLEFLWPWPGGGEALRNEISVTITHRGQTISFKRYAYSAPYDYWSDWLTWDMEDGKTLRIKGKWIASGHLKEILQDLQHHAHAAAKRFVAD